MTPCVVCGLFAARKGEKTCGECVVKRWALNRLARMGYSKPAAELRRRLLADARPTAFAQVDWKSACLEDRSCAST